MCENMYEISTWQSKLTHCQNTLVKKVLKEGVQKKKVRFNNENTSVSPRSKKSPKQKEMIQWHSYVTDTFGLGFGGEITERGKN